MRTYDFAEELRASNKKLRQSKEDLLNIIEEIARATFLVKRDIYPKLLPIMCLGNAKLESAVRFTLLCLQPKKFFFIKRYPSVKQYCSILRELIEKIDAELDNEENVVAIAEKLSKISVSLSDGETDPELEWKIRENAGAIARIIS